MNLKLVALSALVACISIAVIGLYVTTDSSSEPPLYVLKGLKAYRTENGWDYYSVDMPLKDTWQQIRSETASKEWSHGEGKSSTNGRKDAWKTTGGDGWEFEFREVRMTVGKSKTLVQARRTAPAWLTSMKGHLGLRR